MNLINYLGLRHEYGSLDCVILLQQVYNELGISIDIPNYSFSRKWFLDFTPNTVDNWLAKYAIKVPLTSAKNYDLMVFKSRDEKFITHFGMFLQPCKILHVEEGNTSKIETLSDYWLGSLHAVYRPNSLV